MLLRSTTVCGVLYTDWTTGVVTVVTFPTEVVTAPV